MVVALSEQMAPLYRTVVDAGVLLQIDDPAISHDWEEIRRPWMTLEEYERFMMVRVEALNAALQGIPEETLLPPRIAGCAATPQPTGRNTGTSSKAHSWPASTCGRRSGARCP
jgi:hypothetical protein